MAQLGFDSALAADLSCAEAPDPQSLWRVRPLCALGPTSFVAVEVEKSSRGG